MILSEQRNLREGSFIARHLKQKLWIPHFGKCVVICYWFLGLCNNFAYVTMLSAAHDILSRSSNSTKSSTSNQTYNIYDCNVLSTSTILLADILPGLVVKLILPFFMHRIAYNLRVSIVVVLNLACFLIVALTPSHLIWLVFIGVCCASMATAFGELTFLALSTLYSKSLSLTGWSSGTGGAGFIGAFGYAGLTSLGLSPNSTILIMTVIPVIMAVSYILLPPIELANLTINKKEAEPESSVSQVTVRVSKYRLIPKLLKYMIPLMLVYFAQYFINQGLFELLYFPDSTISDHRSQYRWYNVCYQAGVFISRSSIKWFKIKFLPIFPILQFLNLFIALSQIFFNYMPVIWIVFVLVLWEGMVAGGCYANSFDLVSSEASKENREFSVSITSLANNIGIVLAGVVSIPAHNAICKYGERPI